MTDDRSIEELEGFYPKDSAVDSYVIRTSLEAVKKPLSRLSNEEIRLLIGQKIGLKHLIPMAVETIYEEPLIEVGYFEGDLLLQLLRLSESDWCDNKEDFKWLRAIVENNLERIRSCEEIPDKLIDRIVN